jgi:hypothetical protein
VRWARAFRATVVSGPWGAYVTPPLRPREGEEIVFPLNTGQRLLGSHSGRQMLVVGQAEAHHAPSTADCGSAEWQTGSAAGQESNACSGRYACEIISVEVP